MSDNTQRERLLEAARQRRERQGRRGLRKQAPQSRRPEAIIREYRAALRRIAKAMRSEAAGVLYPALTDLLDEAGTRGDAERADDWPQRTARLIESVSTAAAAQADTVKTMLPEIAQRLAQFSDEEQRRLVRSVVGVEPTLSPDIDALLDSWIAENSSLITTMSADAINEVEGIVQRGVRSGASPKKMKREIARRFQISENRAERIARTESGQLYTQIAKKRQTELGIRKFEWVTAEDERVRSSHEARNGKIYSWDDPPGGELPGTPINCRCVARPLVSELLDEMEASE